MTEQEREQEIRRLVAMINDEVKANGDPGIDTLATYDLLMADPDVCPIKEEEGL